MGRRVGRILPIPSRGPGSFNRDPASRVHPSVSSVSDPGRSRDPADAELVELAVQGDARALEQLVIRHQGVVYRFVLGFLKDEDLAADVTQDTFLKVLDRLEGFRGESAFRTWLLAIARNEALGLIRSRGRRREESIDEAGGFEDGPFEDGREAPDARVLEADDVARIRVALDRLPEKQRLSVSLRLFDGLSFREVGEVIGSLEGAARVNYHYGIGRLREWLQ
ncbi:MAG: sigma-70 family RNA polymerase sigma factor [Gemmatimonadetes bacterium]|nr:sigma-70 family RNA polymerase sigma factor [Gemmatimonadota bacterium]